MLFLIPTFSCHLCWQSGKIHRQQPLYNQEILDEYDEVLHRAKFPFSENSIRRILIMIRENGIEVFPYPTGEILPDMDDLMFYEVVMDKRNDDAYLITGNIKHFPKREYIVTPAEMMAILKEIGRTEWKNQKIALDLKQKGKTK